MPTLYIAKYVDHDYPEDNESLGSSWDRAKMEELIVSTRAHYANTEHGKIYGLIYHRCNPMYYLIEEMETPPFPDARLHRSRTHDRTLLLLLDRV